MTFTQLEPITHEATSEALSGASFFTAEQLPEREQVALVMLEQHLIGKMIAGDFDSAEEAYDTAAALAGGVNTLLDGLEARGSLESSLGKLDQNLRFARSQRLGRRLVGWETAGHSEATLHSRPVIFGEILNDDLDNDARRATPQEYLELFWRLQRIGTIPTSR
jgi:hypothetical protein